jgi:glutamine synthetase
MEKGNAGAPGKLTREELERGIDEGEFETVIAVFPDYYGRLLGKRFVGRFFRESVTEHGLHACDYLLACDMEMDPVPGYRFASWEKGYGDFACVPDWSTARRMAWLPKTAIILCDLASEPGRMPIEIAPRRLLRRQVSSPKRWGTWSRPARDRAYLFRESFESARRKEYHAWKPSAITSRIATSFKEQGGAHHRRDCPRSKQAVSRWKARRGNGDPASRRST